MGSAEAKGRCGDEGRKNKEGLPLGNESPVSAFRFPAVLGRGVGSSILASLSEAGGTIRASLASKPLPSRWPFR
jgi:hypothetical protein